MYVFEVNGRLWIMQGSIDMGCYGPGTGIYDDAIDPLDGLPATPEEYEAANLHFEKVHCNKVAATVMYKIEVAKAQQLYIKAAPQWVRDLLNSVVVNNLGDDYKF